MNLPKFVLSGVRRVLPALLLGSVAVSMSAWAGPKQVPFKARITAQEVLVSDQSNICQGIGWVGNTEGKGTASHMGAVQMVATDCPVLSDLPSGFSFGGGRLTLTAANGDEVYATYWGAAKLVPDTFNIYSIDGDYAVNGGTGRFEYASGSGKLRGMITLFPDMTATAEYEVNGTLSYSRK